MAARKAKKQGAANKASGDEKVTATGEDKKTASETATREAASPAAAKKSAKRVARRSKPQAKKHGKKSAPRKGAARKKAEEKAALPATRRGRRKRYSDAARQNILETAKKEGLTGTQVAKRFGVSTLSYYTWRKKAGVGNSKPDPAEVAGAAIGRTLGKAANLADMIRHEIRTRISHLLPEILQSEIGGAVSGPSTGRGRRKG